MGRRTLYSPPFAHRSRPSIYKPFKAKEERHKSLLPNEIFDIKNRSERRGMVNNGKLTVKTDCWIGHENNESGDFYYG
jgi:hypothetical protein